jgi:hypothetical protein
VVDEVVVVVLNIVSFLIMINSLIDSMSLTFQK